MKHRISIKNSISKKLFIITALVFAVFIGATLIIQTVFFERFYINKKISDLETTSNKFAADFNKLEDGDSTLGDLIDEYEGDYNVKIAILQNNRIKLSAKQVKTRTDMNRVRDLQDFINSWTQNTLELQNFNNNRQIGATVYKRDSDLGGTIVSVEPTIGNTGTIFVVSSLQHVNEAVDVIKQIYVYFCIGAVVIIFILAFTYSNMLTKPLIKINKAATKMASLDFSERCEVSSEDEIGSLATSLNFLSENLHNSLTSLRQANAKLEADIEKERNLEKMRKEFIAAVSHELKTPISLIDGYAVGLKDNIFEDKDKDYYLDVIVDEAGKMGHLVSDMLDLSQLESGVFKLRKIEFDLVELIKFTTRKYETIASEKDVAIRLKLMESFIFYGDYNRIEQVLTNFITNALRHVNEKGTVEVRMLDEEEMVSIEVENTGSHISEEELEKIWDKFYKTDKSRNRKFGGTGIGLSIVKNILTLHGFSFGVNNTENGVKFYFKVPKQVTL